MLIDAKPEFQNKELTRFEQFKTEKEGGEAPNNAPMVIAAR